MVVQRVKGQSFELYTMLGTQHEGRSNYAVLNVGRSLPYLRV